MTVSALTDHALALPAHVRRRLASSLEAGLLTPPFSRAALLSALGSGEAEEAVRAVLQELERAGCTGPAAALWLRTIDEVRASLPRPDIVWSGHVVPGLSGRDTGRVYHELFGKAERSVWVSTYVFYDGPSAFHELAERMEAVKDLRVTLLLNIQRKRGDSTAANHLVRRYTDRFWEIDWPGTNRPRVYYDPRSLALDGPSAVLHAKAVVVDDAEVFVTSANLTEAAWERNIELGLLVQDRPIAASISSYFQTLIDRGLLCPLPAP